jgi:hypothetical protein
MEAFESFVALALEAEDFIVTGPEKFKVKMKTKSAKETYQTHGYEVDLVAARADRLVLASVKGFYGSDGVRPKEVTGEAGPDKSSGYKMLNIIELREAIVAQAAEKYGYKTSQVEMRLYGGKFKHGEAGLATVREWASRQFIGGSPLSVYSGRDIVSVVLKMAESKTYRDHPVLMTLKVVLEAGLTANDERSFEPLPIKVLVPKDSKGPAPLADVVRALPIGSTVTSNKDGLTGVVLGHKQDPGKGAYVRIWVDGADKMHLRSAATLEVSESRRSR